MKHFNRFLLLLLLFSPLCFATFEGDPVKVVNGGTQLQSLSAFSILAGGTTSTAPIQQIAAGATTGQVLTYQGSSALPTWNSISAIGISTDWASCDTLTIGATTTPPTKGTSSQDHCEYRRVGDSMEFQYDFVQTGAGSAGSGTYLFPVPNSQTIDTAKLRTTNSNSTYPVVGSGLSNTSSDIGVGSVVAYDSTHLVLTNLVSSSNTIATYGAVGSAVQGLGGSSVSYSLHAVFPISGWSSNTIGASQGAVYANYYVSGATYTPGSGNQINFDTKIADSGCLIGSCLVTTGGSWKFTAPVSGMYAVDVMAFYSSGSVPVLEIYKNGANYGYLSWLGTSAGYVNGSTSSELISLSAGDTIDLRLNSGAVLNGGSAPYSTRVGIVLQSGNGGGNVSSNTTGSEHIERVAFAAAGGGNCTSSPCSIISQSGTWIDTTNKVTRTSTGTYSLNIVSGEFSAAPVCTCSVNGNGTDGTCEANYNSGSTTAVTIWTRNASGSFVDSTANVICMGPH